MGNLDQRIEFGKYTPSTADDGQVIREYVSEFTKWCEVKELGMQEQIKAASINLSFDIMFTVWYDRRISALYQIKFTDHRGVVRFFDISDVREGPERRRYMEIYAKERRTDA